jgi:hypothetical protein
LTVKDGAAMKRTTVIGAVSLVLALLLGLCGSAFAREEIQRFSSSVTINTDGSLSVTETITLVAEGQAIKRGIFRGFPAYFTGGGMKSKAGIEVVSVTRDGKPEKNALKQSDDGIRLLIGDPGVMLEPGVHSYEISYRVTGAITFYEEFDKLFWDITGFGWTFPVQHADVAVTLPAGTSPGLVFLSTGVRGNAGRDAHLTAGPAGQVTAETQRELGPEEGFTIEVSWQKGFVVRPGGDP